MHPTLLPRWWSAFVLPWLLVMVATVGLLVHDGISAGVLVATIALLVAVAAVYLWLTLRAAVTGDDLSETGPTDAQRRQRVAALLGMGGMIVALMLLLPVSGMWWYVMYVVIGAGLALPTRLASVTIGLALATTFGLTWLIAGRVEIMLLIELAFGGGAMAVRQLTLTVSELRVAREELARRAVLEERLRFARDLHDLVGHSLSLIAIKSELARRLLPWDPQAAGREVRDIERGARDALRHVRAAVLGYRQPSLADELAGARELLAAAGLSFDVHMSDLPSERALPGALDALLGWSVREGITNVVRHSRARRCAVMIQITGGEVRIGIADDGRGAAGTGRDATPAGADGAPVPVTTDGANVMGYDSLPDGSGTGLVGLAERARAIGGRVRTGVGPYGGFELVVEAPLDGGRAARATEREGPSASGMTPRAAPTVPLVPERSAPAAGGVA